MIGRLWAVSLGILVPLAAPLAAADLIEPWAPGVSNLEMAVAGPIAGGGRSFATLIGGGITERLSFGVLAGGEAGEDTAYGALLLYSQPLGELGELDVWCETASLDSLDGALCGSEWSRAFARVVPYARLTGEVGAGSATLVPLAGLVVPLGERLGFHVEASLEAAEEDGRPRRLAFGPNWALAPRLELIPELSWTRAAGGEGSFDFSFCMVFDIAR